MVIVVKKQNKDERIALRCTRKQVERWRKEADRQGVSLSEWVAAQCDGAFMSPRLTQSETKQLT